MRRAQRGATLLEMVVAMTIFLLFLTTLFMLTAEMRAYEKRLPISFRKHPQIAAVLTRMRRDVLDAHGKNPYRDSWDGYTASSQVLIVESVQRDGSVQTIVWDFREAGVAHRRAYNVGNATDWWARGLPEEIATFEIDAVRTSEDAAWATRITAKDKEGRIAIDQILQPRATE